MHSALRHIIIAYAVALTAGALALIALPYGPLYNALLADIVATLVIFGFSRRFKNSSFYDAYWSVIPPLLALYWILTGPNTLDIRVWLVFALISFWSIRLTWNWASHWQGLSHEDWRYIDLREKSGPLWAPLMDLFGIHLLPTLQVFIALLPVYVVAQFAVHPLNLLDLIATIVTFGAVMIELIADRQLHRFLASAKPGQFIDSGLWAWSRHPNYFGELAFWSGIMLFALAASPTDYMWAIPGVVLMAAMLHFVSIPMMDQRCSERRTGYADYLQRVPALIPRPPRQHAQRARET
jgi:steroid 5-alpha reductase family enzyme